MRGALPSPKVRQFEYWIRVRIRVRIKVRVRVRIRVRVIFGLANPF